MNIYYEPTADGKFLHASLIQPPVILDSIHPGAVESPNRLEWLANVQKIAQQRMKVLEKNISDFTQSLNILEDDSDNDAASKMIVATALPLLFDKLSDLSMITAGLSRIALEMAEEKVRL